MLISQKFLRTIFVIAFLIFSGSQNGFSFSVIKEPGNPDYLRASVFVNLSAREFAAATGKKLNFFQRIQFKVIQRQIKRDLKKNPDLLVTDYFDQKKAGFKFDALWFVIGAIIGPLGVLFAYTSPIQKKEKITKKDKITSAWLGFLLFVLWFGWLFVF